jgi:hypothetical protein
MNLEKDTLLTSKERQRIIFKVLKEYFRETTGKKRTPSDYLCMFIEGGEADVIAYAIATTQEAKTRKSFLREVYK